MYYGLAYRLQITNVEGQTVTCTIYDTNTASEAMILTNIIEMEGAETPLLLSTIDGDEDKLTPIRAKQLAITFKATNNLHLSTFATGEDERFLVELKVADQVIFLGFLQMDDMRMPFQPPENSEVTLLATDNLGKLKDTELTDFGGDRLKEYYSLKDLIGFCLQKTNLGLEYNIVYNLYEQDALLREDDGCPFAQLSLDDRTFEAGEGKHENCYTVLESILNSTKSVLLQHNQQWWVVRQAEIFGANYAFTTYGSDGNSTSVTQSLMKYKEVQKITDSEDITSGKIFWIDEDAEVGLVGPNRSVKDTYKLELPDEIIRNESFSMGDLTTVLPNTGYTEKHFTLEDWTLGQFRYETLAYTPLTSKAYIYRKYEGDYEQERYAVVEYRGGITGNGAGIRSKAVPVMEKDKIRFSVDYKSNVDTIGAKRSDGRTSLSIASILIYGNSGKIYELYDDGTKLHWIDFVTPPTGLLGFLGTNVPSGESPTQWHSMTLQESPPIPEDGDMYITLIAGYNQSGTGDPDMHYSNLQFTYTPFLNGAYQKYKSTSCSVSQTGRYKNTRDKEVTVGSAPRRLFKGALHKAEGLNMVLVENFKDRTQFYTGGIGLSPWGKWQAFHEWQNYRNSVVSISGTLQGIQSNTTPTDMPDLIHRFTLLDNSPYTNTKYFQLLHYEMDLHLCEIRNVMVQEILDYTKGYDWTSDFQFRWEN